MESYRLCNLLCAAGLTKDCFIDQIIFLDFCLELYICEQTKMRNLGSLFLPSLEHVMSRPTSENGQKNLIQR